jgi:hypothetical protein
LAHLLQVRTQPCLQFAGPNARALSHVAIITTFTVCVNSSALPAAVCRPPRSRARGGAPE